MKDFFSVFRTAFKYCWSEPTVVIILTVFPILIIFVLSSALGSFVAQETELESVPVAVVATENSPLSRFYQSEAITRFLDVTFTDENTALKMLNEGGANTVIIETTDAPRVIVGSQGGMNTQVAVMVIETYTQINAAFTAAMQAGQNPMELNSLIESEINVTPAPLGARAPNGTDYYTVTMLVMIMMFAGLNGNDLFKKFLLSNAGERNLVTPVSKPALVGGLLAASTVTSYIQGLITLFFSIFVYKAYTGESIFPILFVLLAVVLVSQAIAVFFVLLFKNAAAAEGFTQAFIWVLTFVSDGYTKVDFGAAERFFKYTPNSLAHTAIFSQAFGGSQASLVSQNITLLFTYAAVLFIAAFVLGKRRLSV